MLGMHGRYGANLLTERCDVLFAIGMRFDDRVTGDTARFATQAEIIHLDVDPGEIGRHMPTAVGIAADAKSALHDLLPLVEPQERPDWGTAFHAFDAVEHRRVVKKDVYPESGALRMGEVIRHLNAHLAGNGIVVSDVGQHQMTVARYARYERPLSSVSSGGLGTMGFALPAALGARLGDPSRPVVAVVGDGGFQMTLQELGTLATNGIDVKVVVLNNEFLGMVRQWQELFYEGRYASTAMQNPDFVAISKGFGVESARVSEREMLDQAIETMFSTPGPYVLEVQVMKEENVYPMVPSGGSVTDIQLGDDR
jgi:acetolactate synthase-1/2/3 large subunit